MIARFDELNTLKSEVSEIVRAVKSEMGNYDSIDFLIDLLASTVVPIVEEQLEAEYDAAFQDGLGGWISVGSDESDRYAAVHADVAGKTFVERIEEYARGDLDNFESKVATLLETDGHRVRSEGTLAAGSELQKAGLTVTKTWRGVMDEKERDPHVRLEGVTIPYNEQFEIDGFFSPAPGLFGVPHLDCNCRCELQLNVTE